MSYTASYIVNSSSAQGTTDFTFAFPYIKEEHVEVFLNYTKLTQGTGSSQYQVITNVSPKLIRLNTGTASANLRVEVRRNSSLGSPLVDYADGSTLTANDLDTSALQSLYIDQELKDNQGKTVSVDEATSLPSLGESGAGNLRLTKVADPTAAQDAATKNYVDTKVFTSSQIQDGTITSADIANGTIVDADVNASAAIAGSKLQASSSSSAGSMSAAHHTKLDTAVATKTGAETLTNKTLTSPVINDMSGTAVVTSGTSTSDTKTYSAKRAGEIFYGKDTVGEIQSGETWSASDDKVATTSAIDARIVDLVTEVGGFVPLASEATFPAANPDVNNGPGTIVSVGVLSATYSPSSGTCTIPDSTLTNISGSNVTITDCGTTALTAGFGVLVETTSTLHTYKFHRLTPKATEVTTVAGNISNINTVAGNNTNISTVAGNNTNISTVAGANSNITAVAGSISNVNTVATNISDVSNFADLYQIGTSAPSNDGGGNALVAGDLWFDSSSNKTLKVHDGSTFKQVSPSQSVLDDISIVSGSLTRLEDLGNIADSISSGSSTGALDTCATNITNINTFANIYRIASSAPSSSLNEGDLWYDSANNLLKYYNGTTWTVTAAAGLSNLIEDTSPELGNHLDCNDKNLTEVGTISGNNLQVDFGTIT